MDLTVIIQVAIGIMFVWIVLAVITSQIQEWVSSVLAWRSSMLESTVAQMLADPALKDKIYNHPLIQGLHTNNGKRKPAGIPEDKFALILFEEVMNSGLTVGKVRTDFEKLKKNVEALKASEGNDGLKNFATSLDTLLLGIEDKADDATQAITQARQRVEGWFNNSMERLGGAYRRRVQIVAIIVGISVSAILNVDTAAIANTLWRDPVVRQAVVTEASQVPEPNAQPNAQPSQPPRAEDILKNMEQFNALSLPVGWSSNNMPTNANGWVIKIIGILLSGMAAAQGAPYWFDLMRKLVTRNPPVPPQPA